jgi:hypothetical protein
MGRVIADNEPFFIIKLVTLGHLIDLEYNLIV